jgi:V/A-type H+-transporting ATPase subunit A
MTAVLAEADRLAALADLVGIGALPGHERMVMLAGRLLREAVLQQSALSATDASCRPDKAAALVDLVLDLMAVGEELVAAGVPATMIEELDYSTVVRAREDTGPTDLAAVLARRDAVVARLRELR